MSTNRLGKGFDALFPQNFDNSILNKNESIIDIPVDDLMANPEQPRVDFNERALKELAKKLKKTCGSGGSVVDETIEVQGDKREIIQQVLEKAGFKVKFTGG